MRVLIVASEEDLISSKQHPSLQMTHQGWMTRGEGEMDDAEEVEEEEEEWRISKERRVGEGGRSRGG